MCHGRALAIGERFPYSAMFNLSGDRGKREFVSPRFSKSVSGVKLNFRSSRYKLVLQNEQCVYLNFVSFDFPSRFNGVDFNSDFFVTV